MHECTNATGVGNNNSAADGQPERNRYCKAKVIWDMDLGYGSSLGQRNMDL